MESPQAAEKRRPWLRVLLLGAVVIGAMLLVTLTPIKGWLQDGERLRAVVRPLGLWLYPATVVVVAALVACGVPRVLFCMAAGLLLGFWWGFSLTFVGTMIGYYGLFLFTRWGGGEWAMHRSPKLRKWADVIHEQGIVGVILIRQLPLPGTVTNLILGLSPIKHRHFLIGTAVGLIPEAVPLTLVGAGLVRSSVKEMVGYLGIAVVVLAVIWIGCGYALRAMRNSRSGEALMAEAASLKGVGD